MAKDVWRYVSPAASIAELELQIAALAGVTRQDLRTLGRLQFLLSDELRSMLEDVPRLLRRLASSTASDEEWSQDRVQGPIDWPRTLGVRAASGQPQMYVTHPARRAFDTPENRLLVYLLHEVLEHARHLRWRAFSDDEPEGAARQHTAGRVVHTRTTDASHALSRRRLTGIRPSPPSPRELARIRTGRHRSSYRHVLATYVVYEDLIRRVDVASLRDSLAVRTLLAADEGRLFEILCLFRLIDALRGRSWSLEPLRLVQGRLKLSGDRDGAHLELWYETAPTELRRESRYRAVMRSQGFEAGPLRPDFTIRVRAADKVDRWVILESKLSQRNLHRAASAATFDLLAYRRAFDAALGDVDGLYGVGLVWGLGLAPASGSEITLATPDEFDAALEIMHL